ncbi:MAG: hypothetical protein HY647_12510 [Acidobacteria bacterium]|nr:hypothetical protein [Acidobacteriota bacterium]
MVVATNSKFSAAFLVLFCTPFCLVGLGLLAYGVYRAGSAEGEPQEVWAFLLGGLTFSGVGFGLLYAYAMGRKMQARQQQLQALHPQSPWMWREDWTEERAQSNNRSSLIRAWVFAILWNLLSSPVLFFAPAEWETQPLAYVALLFPGVGVLLLGWATLQTLRWRNFGRTWFEMESVPGIPGRELRGRIWTRLPRPAERGVLLKLTSIHRTVSGSGKNRTVNEKILWREEGTVSQGEIQLSPALAAIPVRFLLPADGPETTTENPDSSIHWLLTAEANLPGVDYKDEFEIPVFRTEQSPADSSNPPAQGISFPKAAFVTPEQLAQAGITIVPTTHGTEYRFAAALNPKAAVALTGFLLLWSGAVWLLYALEAPLVFLAVFGLFEVLLIVLALDLWFGATRLTIGSGSLRHRHTVLGLGFTRTLSFAEISGLKIHIGMQSGGRSGTPYYDIRLVLRNGKERTVVSSIRDKRQAEWLQEQIRATIGLKAESGSPL